MKIIGVYKIESLIKPERIYIGSGHNIKQRWGEHLSELRHNKHHSKKLQNHYNKYGVVDLKFSILLCCDKEDLLKTEQYFLDSYNPFFNCCKIAGNCLGIKHSEETRKKMSEHSIGIKHSEESKIKIGNATRGHKVSEEARKVMSECKKGKPTWNKGKKGIYSEETIDKMRRARIGKESWNKGLKYKIKKYRNVS